MTHKFDPITASDRELLSEIHREVQALSAALTEFQPLLNMLRGTGSAAGRSLVQVAGAARAIRREGRAKNEHH